MNNRRLSLLVLVVVGAVIASVQWYLAAEKPVAPPQEQTDELVLETYATDLVPDTLHG